MGAVLSPFGTTATPGGAASGDLGGTYPGPTVTGTHLSAALPVAQGGTGSGTQNFVDLTTGQTVAGAKVLSNNLTVNAHVQFGSTAPSLAIGAGAGTTPPSPVLTTGSNDGAGAATWGTGTSPNTQVQITFTFNTAWVIPGGGAPHIVVSAANAATQALGIYVSGASPTGFSVGVTTAPAASQGNTTYSINYVVMG